MMLIAYLFFSFLPGPLIAESLTHVQSTGYGAIVGGDRATAFEEAKRNALRQAVEEGIGVLLSGHSRVENFAVIEDNIYTKTAGYVRNYEVVDERAIDEQTLALTLSSTVELGALQDRIDALEILIESAGNPYILVLEAGSPNGEVGNHLRSALRKVSDRFNLMVSPDVVGVESAAAAARLGRNRGADIVVYGQYESNLQENKLIPFSSRTLDQLGLYSAVTNAKIEGLWSDTGQVFSTHYGNARAAAGQSQTAVEKSKAQCVANLADSLVKDLVENWREKVYSGRQVRMVANLDGIGPQEFENALVAALGSAQTLQRRKFTSEKAVYDIQSKNSGFDIARHLTLRVEGTFQMTIQQSTLNTITLRVERSL